MALLAEKPIEQIGFAEIAAARRRVARRTARQFGSTLAILAAHIKEIDRKVLAGVDPDMAEEPPRERLFDVLMRRLEALAPHKEAVRSLLRSAARNPGPGARAQRPGGALAAMDADRRRHRRPGPRGMVRAQGSRCCSPRCCAPGSTTTTGYARTMAALDRALARGQRWSGLLDDLCRVPARFCGSRSTAAPTGRG